MRLKAAGRTVDDATDRLRAATPPPSVRAQHAALIDDLTRLGRRFGDLDGEVTTRRRCTGPSVLSALSTEASVAALRSTTAELTTLGPLRWGTALPAPAQAENRSRPNGELLQPAATSGIGRLEIDNGTAQDAVVVLSSAGVPQLKVYVVAGRQVHTDTVPDGRCDVFVTTGNDWEVAGETFGRDCTFERFTQTAALTTTATSSTISQIGLEVPEGNTTPVPVEPDAFPR